MAAGRTIMREAVALCLCVLGGFTWAEAFAAVREHPPAEVDRFDDSAGLLVAVRAWAQDKEVCD